MCWLKRVPLVKRRMDREAQVRGEGGRARSPVEMTVRASAFNVLGGDLSGPADGLADRV